MALGTDHELHKRRLGKNIGIGLTLLAFAAIIFGLTLAKVSETGQTEAFDHAARPSITVESEK